MRSLFLAPLLVLSSVCFGQELVVDYPYNPDYENDGNVGVEDLLQLLAYFDVGFEVDDIVIDEVTLTQWLQTISQTLINQQATIDSLQGLTSALDSTMVADMISSYGGVGGGGCDWQFPEGISGDPVFIDLLATSGYTIPSGKNLYITTSYYSNGSSTYITINGNVIVQAGNFGTPIIAKSGDVVHYMSLTNIPTLANCTGILVDINPQVEPIFVDLLANNYTVPNGKQLFMTKGNHTGQTGFITVDGQEVCESWNRPLPHIIKSGVIVGFTGTPTTVSFTGYLVDEDYFADCGGGAGSSEGGQGEGQNIGDMLYWGGDSWENLSIGSPGSTLQVGVDGSLTWNNNLAIGDDWAGGKIAYLFQPGDPGYIDGETHGFVVHPLHHSDFPQNQTPLGWGCDDIITGINNSTFGEGYNNTLLIASQCPTGNAGVFSNVITCAKFWSDLIYGGYDDWFMPNSSEALVLDSSVLPVDYFVLSEESTTNPLSQCMTVDFYVGGASLSWTGKSAGNLSIGIRQF